MPKERCQHPNGGTWEAWTDSLTQGVEHRTKKCNDCGRPIDSEQRNKL